MVDSARQGRFILHPFLPPYTGGLGVGGSARGVLGTLGLGLASAAMVWRYSKPDWKGGAELDAAVKEVYMEESMTEKMLARKGGSDVPDKPARPAIAGIAGVAARPAVAGTPLMPAMLDLPVMPTMPDLPDLPDVSEVPEVPELADA